MTVAPPSVVEEEAVLLDPMSGFEFEDFFARLLTKLGYGQIEQVLYTQDEGRDILVRSPQGLIVVECKHQPKGSIGRPVVQKLHSAVISSKAARGMLVTTGHFTKEALGYAQKLSQQGTTIEMVDRPILMDMAARAGIKLVSRGEGLHVWTYSIPPQGATKGALGGYLRTFIVSHPRPPEALLTNDHRTVDYRPLYIVTYDIHAVFETAVGVIHREQAEGEFLPLDGNTGQPFDPAVIEFLRAEPQVPFLGPPQEFRGSLPTFQVDATTLLGLARAHIIRIHTRTVRYSGRNNQTYHKVCEPGERDVLIRDVRQVHLPFLRLEFQLAQTPYALDAQQAPSGRLRALGGDLHRCRACQTSIPGRALLCDVCGRVTHLSSWLLSRTHGFRCKVCGRSVCRFHGYWTRRFLLGKRRLCPPCAERVRKEGQRVREIGPLAAR